jgi:hypothetical protein
VVANKEFLCIGMSATERSLYESYLTVFEASIVDSYPGAVARKVLKSTSILQEVTGLPENPQVRLCD